YQPGREAWFNHTGHGEMDAACAVTLRDGGMRLLGLANGRLNLFGPVSTEEDTAESGHVWTLGRVNGASQWWTLADSRFTDNKVSFTSAEFERFSRLTPYIASGLVLYKYETSGETGEWQEADILFPTETADGFWVTLQLRPRTAWTVEED